MRDTLFPINKGTVCPRDEATPSRKNSISAYSQLSVKRIDLPRSLSLDIDRQRALHIMSPNAA